MGRKGARGAGLRERVEPAPIEKLLKELIENRTRQGQVKWFDTVKGYGFIENDEADVYFHNTAVSGDRIESGQLVKYNLKRHTNGKLSASMVEVIEKRAQKVAAWGRG